MAIIGKSVVYWVYDVTSAAAAAKKSGSTGTNFE